MIFSADFETTTDELDCRVWAYGMVEVGNPLSYFYGNSIDELMAFCSSYENHTLYFHNLAFDGEFILNWLFRNNFRHVKDRKELETKTFTTLISDKGLFYSIEIVFKKQGKKVKKVTIYDSLKIIPLSVKQTAKGFGLPISKLKIDYKKYREVGHKLDEQEVEYLKNDVSIVSMALKTLFDQGLTSMTQGSNALNDYKKIVGTKNFERWFPMPDYDADIRQSYKGGFTFLQPHFKEIGQGEGIVLDVNSLYPSVMYECPLPYGHGVFFEGEYQEDNVYNLYVQSFVCQFEIKPNHIPTIQIKHGRFVENEYLTSSEGEDVSLCLTNVDLKLFFDHYDVYNIEYISGWKFKSTNKLFKDYIDKWNGVKVQAQKEGNKGMRQLAKLMLNSLYGKFALNPIVQSKIPYFEDNKVKYKLGEQESRKPIYIPAGSFITAWARNKTIRSAQQVYDNFIYADTDSLHLRCVNETVEELLERVGSLIEIHSSDLGKWKHESTFRKARFLRQKSYIEDEIISKEEYESALEEFSEEIEKGIHKYYKEGDKYYRLKITCAGMQEASYPYVTWENFHIGSKYEGKLQRKRVEGGVILKDTEFTIKGR